MTSTRMTASAWPGSMSMLVVQVRYQVLTFMRSPVGLFFTIGLPTIMLLLFNSLFGDGTVTTDSGEWSVQQFYTGGLAAFTAVSATYTNLVNVVPIRRDEGILKRWRSTPVPPWVYIAGWVISAVAIAFVAALLQLMIGTVFYSVELSIAKVPAMVVTFAVGVSAFAALGLAVASVVPNADSAPAVANATILPLAFISDVFIAMGNDTPRWLEIIGNIFPLKPFVNAFQDTLNPFVDAPAFDWGRLAFVAAWGGLGVLIALKKFTWEPSARGSRKSRRKRTPRAADAAQPSA